MSDTLIIPSYEGGCWDFLGTIIPWMTLCDAEIVAALVLEPSSEFGAEALYDFRPPHVNGIGSGSYS